MTIANIQTLTNFLVGATGGTSGSLTDANFLIFLNNSYERIVAKIIEETAGARWQFGDFNYTAFPTFTITLTDNVQSYNLTNISTTPLTIMGVEVVDINGNQRLLKQISLKEIHESGIAFGRYMPTKSLPYEYEIRDNLIVLYPPPSSTNVTLTNGLIIYYLRTAQTFTEAERATGTKVPGFSTPYNDILAYETAYLFAGSKGMENTAWLKSELDRKEKEFFKFISKRDQNDRPIMTMKPIIHF